MKILITQTASLGDVILSTPVISALRRNYPQAELWFLSSAAAAQLLKADPDLKGTIFFDKKGADRGIRGFLRKSAEIRAHKFDMVFAIQRSARVSMLLAFAGIKKRIGFDSSVLPFLFTDTVPRKKNRHDVERNLGIIEGELNVQDSDKELRLFAPVDLSLPPAIAESLGGVRNYICVFPGSLWYTKRWHSQNFAELGKALKERGLIPVFLGSAQEKELVNNCASFSQSVSLAGQTNLQELLYIVANSRLVICNDSSSLHIAAAFKIPTVAIFCATSPEMGFGPWRNDKSRILGEPNLWCRPCSRHGSAFCPTGSELCMKGTEKGVSVKRVVEEISALI